jgi:hypothetical protein
LPKLNLIVLNAITQNVTVTAIHQKYTYIYIYEGSKSVL